MKNTGIVRRVDGLGRVVLPKEIRDSLHVSNGTPLELYIDDNGQIILKKYERGCIFCSTLKDIVIYKGKKICLGCLEDLNK